MNAKTIIERLLARGLTQQEIARRSGNSQSTISHLYTGTRGKRTSFETVQSLSDLLSQIEADAAPSTEEKRA
ncbi:helix-turn-helix domain-containing protein [Ralstonia thomasii]|uniref:helix-turn-helix domain-containing protein n=1 Tax=Ralstonia TaxID=48736 RepID=UPI0009B5EC23|nr:MULTISPECIES: helix-turn-helix transcriptional regulator [Ralstonia]MBT2177760.1 helix-turn-helix domain-containing protein [Ralstonia pickettii]